MRRIFQKELDMILHWNLTLVGGFLGTYAILLHAGNFGSAQTGNVMEMAAALTGKNFAEVGIRFLAFLIFGSAIVISYLLTNFTKLDMRKLVLWVDAAGLTVTAMMPEGMSAVVSLYPIFFCSAFQWGSYSGASGYNSASIFTTNNFKQSLLAWTQFVLTKDPEFRRKGIMYTMTVLSFFVGACIGCFAGSKTRNSGRDDVRIAAVIFKGKIRCMLMLSFFSPADQVLVYFQTKLFAALKRDQTECSIR